MRDCRRGCFSLFFLILAPALYAADAPDALRTAAADYYEWRKEALPVRASDQGFHVGDGRLTDYSAGSVAARRRYVHYLLERVRAMRTDDWQRGDRIDWLLFRSQLEREDFEARVMRPEETNPLVYVEEASNAVFSLLKKDYDAPRRRALSATARLRAMPAMLRDGHSNLTAPVRLYAQLAIESARSIDPLFTASLMTLAGDLSPAEKAELVAARDTALASIHAFADQLESRLAEMPPFRPMGEENYNYMLRHVYLLPLNAAQLAMLGEAELARYRGLEALLPDPAMANPEPSRNAHIPKDQREFLEAYESREAEMIRFLKERDLITIPDTIGHFSIRQLPDAFKPTSPGGFMNPPGLYDRDPGGFYFIPAYSPTSSNFYIRAAIEEPRPILGHEGIPGHFLQISIANGLANEIRRQQNDGVFIEGWALYTEEMLLRRGFYAPGSAAEGQILRLSRYRAARVGVDVNLHTGRWTFEEAVKYFMDAGGLDRESATGEAAGAASEPGQKMTYITGKWQILRLLGKYRDARGEQFTLKGFHNDLLRNGSLPLSIAEWLLLDNPGEVERSGVYSTSANPRLR